MNQYEVIQHVADAGEIDRLQVVSMLARLGNEIVLRQEQAKELQGQLTTALRESSMHQINARAHEGMREHDQQCIRDLETVLKAAEALLTDWVIYNDNKKNADIAPATHALLKKLEDLT